MHEEGTLHAHAVSDAPHGETLGEASALALDHDALENLDPFFVAFGHPRVDFDGIARAELSQPLFLLGIAQQMCHIHCQLLKPSSREKGAALHEGFGAAASANTLKERPSVYHAENAGFKPRELLLPQGLVSRSGRRARVLASATSLRQRAIRSWSPDKRTSGTAMPRKTAGLV